jgi:hypothetical protein
MTTPTLGIILCTVMNDVVVRYVLDKSRKKIFASRCQDWPSWIGL